MGTYLASLLPDRPSRVQDAHDADGALLRAGPVIASVRSLAECAAQGNALHCRSPLRHEDAVGDVGGAGVAASGDDDEIPAHHYAGDADFFGD